LGLGRWLSRGIWAGWRWRDARPLCELDARRIMRAMHIQHTNIYKNNKQPVFVYLPSTDHWPLAMAMHG
jgi:hypothetical protein